MGFSKKCNKLFVDLKFNCSPSFQAAALSFRGGTFSHPKANICNSLLPCATRIYSWAWWKVQAAYDHCVFLLVDIDGPFHDPNDIFLDSLYSKKWSQRHLKSVNWDPSWRNRNKKWSLVFSTISVYYLYK